MIEKNYCDAIFDYTREQRSYGSPTAGSVPHTKISIIRLQTKECLSDVFVCYCDTVTPT